MVKRVSGSLFIGMFLKIYSIECINAERNSFVTYIRVKGKRDVCEDDPMMNLLCSEKWADR